MSNPGLRMAWAALAAVLAGGCGWRPGEIPVRANPAFATAQKLTTQAETIPDQARRDDILATIEQLKGQLTFGSAPMPAAARLLLAREIHILPTTQVADWNNDGTLDGFAVLLEAFDHFGDQTKLVGKLYFELFGFREASSERRSLTRLGYWEVNIETARDTLVYWDRFFRHYHFNLVWAKAPEVGRKYIFQVTYVAPWGEIIEAQRTLTRGK